MQSLSDYIKANWAKTIRTHDKVDDGVYFKLPKPFTVPGLSDGFNFFYYWDTYFTNIGLIIDGMVEQAENNLENMAFLIYRLGYMPNGDRLINRTQPPFFTRGVYDLYKATGDKRVIEKFIHPITIEFDFFETDRQTPCGLCGYKHNATNAYLWSCYDYMVDRVGLTGQTEYDKLELVSDLLSLCESGWDFAPRCESKSSPFSAREFAFLDLNCILYDAETKASEMLSVIGDKEKSEKYLSRALNRKNLINELMRDKDTGVYYDYNFKEDRLSSVLSAVSFMPFALGISCDKNAMFKTLEKLEFEHGISACEYRKDKIQLQWDYPMMWPSNVYFAVEGLKALGLFEHAKRVADKYTVTLESVYAETGKLWEKYDAVSGKVAFTPEYETPPMMGWTAGVYKHLKNI